MAFLWRYAGLLAITTTLIGCTAIEPWERGTLAKKHMAINPHPLQGVMRTHVHNSREAAIGGEKAAGGGCGCY